ncbi:MAG TPA: TolC family protein [Steroidobacteraceae bacterium]|nr:TolC family protein [Steroidobacteraceae bacterium]
MSVPPNRRRTKCHWPLPRSAAGALLGAALLLAAACTVYRTAPLDPRRSAADFAARRLDSPQVRAVVLRLIPQAAAQWPPTAWDRAQLLAAALADNPRLAVARAEVRSALARETTAAQLPNPDLMLRSEYARDDAHPWLYGLSLNWLIRSPERRRLEMKIARLGAGNAELGLMNRVWSVRLQLDAALSVLQDARRRMALLKSLSAAQDRLLALQRRRVAAGEDPPAELVGAQRARLETLQQQAHLRALADAAGADAAAALGLPPRALAGVRYAWPHWGAPPRVGPSALRDGRERALLSRADLGAAIGAYAAAEARLKSAIARQYPQFTLGPGYYWDHGIAKFPLDVGFTLPLNRNRGQIAEARADRELAGQRMLALQAAIYGEIGGARRAELTARASVRTAERELSAVRRQARQADLAVSLGESGAERRLGAAIIVARTELAVVQARAQLQRARIALEDALHAPLSGPELALATTLSEVGAGAGS